MPMKRTRLSAPIRSVVLCAVTLLLCATGARVLRAQSSQSGVPNASQVVSFLNQTLEWHRQIATTEQLATEPPDTLFVSDNRQLDIQTVRLSFDFARAAAALQPGATVETDQTTPPNRYQALQKSAAAAEAEVK